MKQFLAGSSLNHEYIIYSGFPKHVPYIPREKRIFDKSLKVYMKRMFLHFCYERTWKIWNAAIYHFLTSYLVPELQNFEELKSRQKEQTRNTQFCDMINCE